jgi:hypothetical protein
MLTSGSAMLLMALALVLVLIVRPREIGRTSSEATVELTVVTGAIRQ